MARLKEQYKAEVAPALYKKFGYKSTMQIPKIDKVVVNVGSVDHPMLEEHWIQFICLVTDKGYQIHPLAPGEAPHAEFVIAEGETPLKVYEHCNLHGLWVTEI